MFLRLRGAYLSAGTTHCVKCVHTDKRTPQFLSADLIWYQGQKYADERERSWCNSLRLRFALHSSLDRTFQVIADWYASSSTGPSPQTQMMIASVSLRWSPQPFRIRLMRRPAAQSGELGCSARQPSAAVQPTISGHSAAVRGAAAVRMFRSLILDHNHATLVEWRLLYLFFYLTVALYTTQKLWDQI